MPVTPRVASRLRSVALAIAGAALAFALLERAPAPWVALGLLALAALAWTGARAASRRRRLLALYLGAALAVPVGAEAWLAVRGRERLTGYDPRAYFTGDEVLGYALHPDQRVRAVREVGGERAYDVTYTIDARGLRVEPPVAPGGAGGCVLFFGGSYTFGEGVEDDETLPYRVGVRAGGRLRVVNFGMHGYGPHQMLAALEAGRVEAVLAGCTPRAVLYQGGWFHAFRSAGRESWDALGPRFVLTDRGEVVQRGHFDDDPGLRVRRVLRARLERSFLFRRLDGPRRRLRPEDETLYVAIVARAAREVQARWPGTPFHVLLWDEPSHPVETRLEAAGLRVHRVSGILPGWPASRERWVLARDGHPAPRAHDRLAAYVVETVLEMPPSAARPAGPGG